MQSPKKKWTRGGLLNPSDTIISPQELVEADMKNKLIWIFGAEIYEECVNAATQVWKSQDQENGEIEEEVVFA